MNNALIIGDWAEKVLNLGPENHSLLVNRVTKRRILQQESRFRKTRTLLEQTKKWREKKISSNSQI